MLKNIAVVVIFLSLLVLNPNSAKAQTAYKSAMDILEHCNKAETAANFIDQAICLGYLTGTIDSFQILRDVYNVCTFARPENLTPRQIILILKKHSEENPEKLNMPGSAFILLALKKAYPCNEEEKTN